MKFLLKSFLVLAVILSIAQYVTPAQAAGPLGTELIFYDFEDVATGTTTDGIAATSTNQGSGGATYDGTYVGNASSTDQVVKFGSRSGSFNNTVDYLRTYYGNGINPTTQSISVSMWVWKKEVSGCGGGDDHVFGVSGVAVGTRFYLRCVNATSGWGTRFGADVARNATTTTVNQSWQHLAVVFDSGTDTITLYVNGVVRATSTAIASFTLGDNFFVGNFNDRINNTFNEGGNAYIDNFGLYTTALSAGNVATLYGLGVTPGQPTGLTATPYENKVFLTWTSPGGTFDDYKIEYKLTSEPTTWTTFSDGVSTTASTTVTGLVNGSSYDFRVSTVNGALEGPVSSTATTIPWYRITFISPTSVTANSTTTSTVATVHASSTNLTSSTTHTIRLETGAGSLVSQVSTTTRYGNQNLTSLISQGTETDLSLADNSSGIAYVSTTNSLFVVHNRAVDTTSEIDEISTTGTLIRTINCTSCGDIEGIALLSSVASTTALGVYDHTFMISTENNLTNAEIFRVVIPSPAASTTALHKGDNFLTGVNHGSNFGLEGIAYNPTSGVFYVAEEKSSPALYEVTLGPSNTTSTSTICTNLNFTSIATDFSDLTYSNGILYLLSDENNRIIPLDVSSTSTCKYVDSDGDNGGVPSTTIDTGDFLNSLIATDSVSSGRPQPEGITWDSTGEYLYVLAEGDFLKKYRAPITIRHTFTGLADGSYALKSSFLDTNGVTANASQLNFGVDTTGPVSSNIASTTGETTATVTWDTDEAATSKVSYGTVSSTYTTSTSSASLVTSHSLGLTGLSASTQYYYVVVSADTLGHYSTSSEKTLLTTAAPDTTDPSATLTAPTNGATVSGASVSLTASAADNVAVAGVKFYINGALEGAEDTTSTYGITWNSTGVVDGSYTILAVARDTSNNYATSSSVTVTVNNASPTPDPTPTPAASASVGGGSGFSPTFSLFNPILPTLGISPYVKLNLPASSALFKPLSFGVNDAQVKTVQKILNMSPDTQVSLTGAGSPGKETTTYLTKTREAVKKFQLKYKIVKSVNDPGYGNIGPATRKKMNELLFN